MRIVAGKFRGRKIIAPKGEKTRPTEDRVKEALFSILTDVIYSSVFVDLFSGSGSIGLEAISRGAGYVYFNDLASDAQKAIKSNLSSLGLEGEGNYSLTRLDFKSFIEKCDFKNNPTIVYIDPPFSKGLDSEALESFLKRDEFKQALFVVESQDKFLGYDGYELIKEKRYGRINLFFLKRSI